jgi:hypothetical protein
MELFYTDAYHVSLYVGREISADWGARTSPWNLEMWLGRTYVCASFAERRIKRDARIAAVFAFAFVMGWVTDPPQLMAISPIVQEQVIIDSSPALLQDAFDI